MKNNETFLMPPALQPGDTIAFVAPARSQTEERINAAKTALEERGYKVVLQSNISSEYKGYLNAPDEERARLLMEAFTDPEIDAIFPVAGGFTATRMIDYLDYDVIRQNPKIVIGYSDITALHMAIETRAHVVSFHSPFPTYSYFGDEDKSFPIDHFWKVLEPKDSAEPITLPFEPTSIPVKTLVGGKATGRLTGGNMSLLHALYGTPYFPEPEGRILFIEEVGEDPYRIDRMLGQLQLGGFLDNLNGVVIGRFYKCETDDPSRSFTLQQVFDDYFGDRPYPVIQDFPVGHVLENVPMPNGALVELDADAGTVTLLEFPQ